MPPHFNTKYHPVLGPSLALRHPSPSPVTEILKKCDGHTDHQTIRPSVISLHHTASPIGWLDVISHTIDCKHKHNIIIGFPLKQTCVNGCWPMTNSRSIIGSHIQSMLLLVLNTSGRYYQVSLVIISKPTVTIFLIG